MVVGFRGLGQRRTMVVQFSNLAGNRQLRGRHFTVIHGSGDGARFTLASADGSSSFCDRGVYAMPGRNAMQTAETTSPGFLSSVTACVVQNGRMIHFAADAPSSG